MGVKGPFSFLTRPAAEKRERDGRVGPRKWDVLTLAPFIRLIIRLFQLVFFSRNSFFSHNKSANSIFQPAYQHSRTAPLGFAPKIMHVSDLTFYLKFPVFKLGSISIENRSDPRPVRILACFERKAIQGAFSSFKVPKILQDSLSHRIFGRMHEVLNVGKKNN
jgi:hypothetical protein